jgi:EAL domain-containing protein (putative c-di-GMP-specific phosphodiesterase class I)/DNA-binding NarL/FixJ family response regulator
MSYDSSDTNLRILIVDDNPAIHEDFRKILRPSRKSETQLAASENMLFGDSETREPGVSFDLDFAFQGDEGIAKARLAKAEQQPYAAAFIDVRMPPGRDGIDTAARIWEVDPDIQVVICTAYSDHTWEQMQKKLGRSDRLVVLKKPFDNIEVLQLADTLTHRWQRARVVQRHLATLQQIIADRTNDLNTAKGRLETAHRQIAVAAQHGQQMMSTQARHRAAIEDELRHAVQAGELTVHYQPLVDIGTRRAIALEALVRWHHPKKGAISPAIFIPVAEESELILEVGEFVLRSVCEQVVQWQAEGTPVVPVAVNISAVQLKRQGILEPVRRVLRETGMRPDLLVLELTESALIENVQQHIRELQSLRDDGVGIEIDDFGTGYSSLSYLRQLPIDTLKIDSSFVRHIDTNPVDAAIVSAILAMAASLQLRVVAEGVETQAQLQVLSGYGCGFAQGFFFSRPLPAPACRTLLLELAARPSFTDTLRMRLVSDGQGPPRLVVAGRSGS